MHKHTCIHTCIHIYIYDIDNHIIETSEVINKLRIRHNLKNTKTIVHFLGSASMIYLTTYGRLLENREIIKKRDKRNMTELYPTFNKVFSYFGTIQCFIFDR